MIGRLFNLRKFEGVGPGSLVITWLATHLFNRWLIKKDSAKPSNIDLVYFLKNNKLYQKFLNIIKESMIY